MSLTPHTLPSPCFLEDNFHLQHITHAAYRPSFMSSKCAGPIGWLAMWPGAPTPLNILALVWAMYFTVWLSFPTTLPTNGTNVNCALTINRFGVVLMKQYIGFCVVGGIRRDWI